MNITRLETLGVSRRPLPGSEGWAGGTAGGRAAAGEAEAGVAAEGAATGAAGLGALLLGGDFPWKPLQWFPPVLK